MKKQLFGLAAASLLAFSVNATDIPYNFAELGYSSVDLDVIDGDGFKVAGSFSLTDDIYAFGDYGSYGLPFDADLGYLGLGLGYRYEISPNIDVNLDLAFRGADIDVPGNADDTDENGYEIGLGVRSLVASNIELGARIEAVDIDGSDTFFEINGTYYLQNGFGIGGEASFGDDFDFYGIKLRYIF